jgi:hypothetical protein
MVTRHLYWILTALRLQCRSWTRDRTVKRPFFCTVGLLPVLPGEDVPGHDEPGPRPRHLGHL